MKINIETVYQFIPAVAFVAGSIIVGLIFERLVLRKLKKITRKTSWKIDDIIIGSLQGKTILWFLIAGIYGALYSLPFLKKDILALLTTILIVILMFSATLVLARIAAGFVTLYSKSSKTALPESSIITNITKLFVILIGLLIIMQYLGVSITPILTALGVGGLAVALALQETLSNLFSGIHIIVTGQIKLGDYIKLDTGEEGHVVDITWRNSTIKTILQNLVVIPNSKMASTIITNFSLPAQEMSVMVPVGVSYGSDLEHVERVTIDVAREVMKEVHGGMPEFEPYIRYHTFADFSINFNVVLRAQAYIDMYPLKHEFVKRLHRRYKQEGIEIPFPIRTVYMKDNQRGGDEE
jgi:small-conductance mechanosensitive channel